MIVSVDKARICNRLRAKRITTTAMVPNSRKWLRRSDLDGKSKGIGRSNSMAMIGQHKHQSKQLATRIGE